jgi:DNA-binding NtrC family response regulator
MSTKRLLIIDDEADFGRSVSRVAEKLGFEVAVTTRARDFKTAYQRLDPTVVILDIVMPETDGTELVQWLASVKSKAHIIVVTGFTPLYAQVAEKIGKAYGLASVSRLTKPVSLATLTACLENALPPQ